MAGSLLAMHTSPYAGGPSGYVLEVAYSGMGV